MKKFYHQLQESDFFKMIIDGINHSEKMILSNLTTGLKGFLSSLIFEKMHKNILIVTESDPVNVARLFCHPGILSLDDFYFFPFETLDSVFADKQSPENSQLRMTVLQRLIQKKPSVIVSSVEALLKYIPDPVKMENQSRAFHLGDKIEITDFVRLLTENGYVRASQAEEKGQFALRGGIVDVFSVTEDNPWRFDFFDDEIENITVYDPVTQCSVRKVTQAVVIPASEQNFNDEGSVEKTLLDYFGNGIIILDEPGAIREAADDFLKQSDSLIRAMENEETQVANRMNQLMTYADLSEKMTPFPQLLWSAFIDLTDEGKTIDCHSRHLESFSAGSRASGDFSFFRDYIQRKLSEGNRIVIHCRSEQTIDKMKSFIQEQGFSFLNHHIGISFEPFEIAEGFELTDQNTVFMNESEIFSRREKRRRHRFKGKKIDSFSQLSVGEYVVHDTNGIGIYRGVEQIEISGRIRDMMIIEYAGNDRFYLPVEQMDTVQVYIGGGSDKAPVIHHLGSSAWHKAKSRARKSVEDMADELIALYAKRRSVKGYAFGVDTIWQNDFEDDFPYDETDDQLRSIEEIKADMEKPVPMDRLLCGDVGYGKTEVALRAAFKAIMDGKQVALLVPTTVLAQQHYNTIIERFKKFPVRSDLICRFRTQIQQKKTLEGIASGQIDLLVGTHRLLSKDIQFKDLGLLIIDEEQRFGVKAKEKLKAMKHNVDVLALSATPIPRTLHMSMSGIRDMSVIEEPPFGRRPVQTYVMRYHPVMIANAINRELARQGQVYYIHNRVQSIDETAATVHQMVPGAKIAVAHGQMTGPQLEKIMVAFMEKQYDVLVSTAIVESGLDIPNVNTMIIDHGDHFGLSQLYQLRGRVGRSERQAYCYVTYRKETLNETAQKRLKAIKDFTAFGSGFKIAMRDLEIRGAGNILGAEQSGHLFNIGYEMYCRLLEEAVQGKLTGKAPVNVDTSVRIMLNADAFIPEQYISDDVLKFEIYKKIAAIRSESDLKLMGEELQDRFGPVPESVNDLMMIARIKYLAALAGMKEIRQQEQVIRFYFNAPEDMPLPRPEVIYQLYDQFGLKLKGSKQTDLAWSIFLEEKKTDRQLKRITAFLEMLKTE